MSLMEDMVRSIKEQFMEEISRSPFYDSYFVESTFKFANFIWTSTAGVHITSGEPSSHHQCISRVDNPKEFSELIEFMSEVLDVLNM